MAEPAEPRTGWFRRNVAWFVPTLVAGLLALFGGCIFGLFSLIMGAMKGSDIYQDALARARTDATVQAELGTPIEDGWMPSGKVSYRNAGGSADLTIQLKGPKGEATLYVVASRAAARWRYATLRVVTRGGRTIELVDDGG